MRTGKAAPLGIAVGLFGMMLLATAPPASACTLLSGTNCIMDIYYNERNNAYALARAVTGDTGGHLNNAQGKINEAKASAEGAAGDAEGAAGEAQAQAADKGGAWGQWGSDRSEEAGACAAPAPSPGPVPTLPSGYDPGPAVDGNVQYAEDQQGVAGRFAGSVGGNPIGAGGATADALVDGYGNTEDVFRSWDENVFKPLITDPAQEFSEIDTGEIEVPDLPTPEDVDVGDPGGDAAERGGCAAGAADPLPAL